MPFQKVEFEFPDPEKETTEIEIESAKDVTDITEKPTVKTEAKQEVEKDLEADFKVEVVDDTPPKDRNRKPSEPPADITDDELGEYSEKVKKRIQHFSKGYHDERRRAEAAQREREEAVRVAQALLEENNRLKGDMSKSQEAMLAQAKTNVTHELEQAKRAYKAAYEAGDSDKVLEAQEALTAAKIKADKIANVKIPPLQKQETEVKPQPTTPAPVADTRAVEWQKANPWFGTDDEMTSLALGLHQKLVREGIDPRSDEYYDRINGRMRQLFPDQFESAEEPPPVEKPRRSNVVAPATRSTAPRKIVLTQSQVNLAKRLGLTPEQYARSVAEEMRKQNG